MQGGTTIGLDIVKSVFQVHGVDAHGKVVVRRQLKRRYVLAFFKKLSPCLVGIEACATSHHWSGELQALGHTVRLMPPAYVKPYLKRQKNDAADAEAICEAVARPNMRFVATKTAEQQSSLMLHRTRHLFVRQQNAVLNCIRAHLAELGIVAPVGRNGVRGRNAQLGNRARQSRHASDWASSQSCAKSHSQQIVSISSRTSSQSRPGFTSACRLHSSATSLRPARTVQLRRPRLGWRSE